MRVRLNLKTKNMEKGKVAFKKFITVKEAKDWYETNAKKEVTLAYLSRFDGWHWHRYKTLYEEE